MGICWDQGATEKFVSLWMEGKSRKEIAAELGVTPNSVATRATILRDMGIALPYRKRGGAHLDLGKLKALVGK